MSQPKQFGIPQGDFTIRNVAYGVIRNAEGKILTLNVNDTYHLPGGGIDPGEQAETSFRRELMEEAGCVVEQLNYVGEANQFYQETKLGPMNKVAVFYVGEFKSIDNNMSDEDDHAPEWLLWEQIQNSNMADFQKWAVEQAIQQ